MQKFKSRTVSRVGLLLLTLLSLVGCHAQIYLPIRVMISGETELRKNDCYPYVIEVQADGGASLAGAGPLQLQVATNSIGVLYRSEAGCNLQNPQEEQNTFALSPATPRITIFVRAVDTGTLVMQVGVSGFPLAVQQQESGVGFSTFNVAGGFGPSVWAIAYDAGRGQFYVGGRFRAFSDFKTPGLGRINLDGSIDRSFLAEGKGLQGDVYALAVQSDGRVLVGGTFTQYNGVSRINLLRTNTDGSLDTSFAPVGTSVDGTVNALAVQSDGKILVGGQFTTYNGVARRGILRLNSNGTLDGTFALTGTGLNGNVYAIAIHSNGTIYAAGSFSSYNGTSRVNIARLTATGALDAGFAQTGTGVTGGYVPNILTIAIQPDDRVLVGGSFTNYNGTTRNNILRLNANGSLDGTFAPTGTGLDAEVRGIALLGNGKVVAGGIFSSYNGAAANFVIQLNANGTRDSTFVQSGTGLAAGVSAVAALNDGRILAGGYFIAYGTQESPALAFFDPDGSLNRGFAPARGGFDSSVEMIAKAPNGKMVLAGYFTRIGPALWPGFARINTDGTADTSFVITGSGFNSRIRSLDVHANGKIVCGGGFSNYGGVSRQNIARINADGSLDTTFNTVGWGLSSQVYILRIQPDEKVVVGGAFTMYDATVRNRIARLNPDGTLDTGFLAAGSGLNFSPYAMAIQPDGKIVVGGTFTTSNGVAAPYVTRLNSDGTLDSSFSQTGTGLDNSVESLTLQPDGKILVVGNFSNYNGIPRGKVARLNADGSLDQTFVVPGTGFNGQTVAVGVQADGRIIVGGTFSRYDTDEAYYLAALNSDGSFDLDFYRGLEGLNASVESLLVQSDAKVVVGGYFTSYDFHTIPYLFRMTSRGRLD